ARLRATALPTLRLAVKPTRSSAPGAPSPAAGLVWRMSPGATNRRRPAATARKSTRRLSRPTRLPRRSRSAGLAAASGAQPLATLGAPGGQDLAASHGGHARAEAMAALPDEHTGLISALHDRLR